MSHFRQYWDGFPRLPTVWRREEAEGIASRNAPRDGNTFHSTIHTSIGWGGPHGQNSAIGVDLSHQ